MKCMRRIGSALGVLVMVVLSCAWPAACLPSAAAHTPTHRAKKRSSPARKASPPSQDGQTVESGEGAVEWDPISCWDCETTGDPVVAFVAGLIVTTPVCLLIIRSRTRRGEAEAGRRILEL